MAPQMDGAKLPTRWLSLSVYTPLRAQRDGDSGRRFQAGFRAERGPVQELAGVQVPKGLFPRGSTRTAHPARYAVSMPQLVPETRANARDGKTTLSKIKLQRHCDLASGAAWSPLPVAMIRNICVALRMASTTARAGLAEFTQSRNLLDASHAAAIDTGCRTPWMPSARSGFPPPSYGFQSGSRNERSASTTRPRSGA